jgi:hypothetical protein
VSQFTYKWYASDFLWAASDIICVKIYVLVEHKLNKGNNQFVLSDQLMFKKTTQCHSVDAQKISGEERQGWWKDGMKDIHCLELYTLW